MHVHTFRHADLCSYQNGVVIMYLLPSISDISVLPDCCSLPHTHTPARHIQCVYQIAVGPVCVFFVLAVLGVESRTPHPS